jgi:tetratricopeptide (TPR) repeat protein
LDPLQDEALRIVAESWEQQGDLERALEWYDRYLETIPDSQADERVALETYVRALRRQQ